MNGPSDRTVIDKCDLPHCAHDRVLLRMEKDAAKVFRLVTKMIIMSVKKALEIEGIAKSEKHEEPLEKTIPTGWLGETTQINIDFTKLLGGIIDQYLGALNYMLLGSHAGKKAKDYAIALGLVDRMKYPGCAYGAFLSSLDAQSEFYKMLEGKSPDDIPSKTLEVAFGLIQKQVKKMADDSLDRYKSKMIEVVSSAYRQNDFQNIMNSLTALQDDEGETDHKEVIDDAHVEIVSVNPIVKALREVNENAEKDFSRLVDTSLSMSSSTGNFAGMATLFGADGSEMRAALVSIRDDRCCDHCQKFSLNPDGSYRIYPLSAFKPAGTNFSLKQKDWVLTISPVHHKCRCTLVYLPRGWKITNDGDLIREG